MTPVSIKLDQNWTIVTVLLVIFFFNFYNSPVDKPKLGPKCPHSMILASVRAHYLSGCHLLHLHKLVVWS